MTFEKVAAGERVYLRPVRVDDIDDRYVSWYQDPALTTYFTGSQRTFSREDLLAEIERGLARRDLFVYVICRNSDDRPIGTIKVGPIDSRHRTSDLVALIGDRDEHGKGLASEAIRLGNEVAFRQHAIRKLFGGMYEANEASIRAYTRAGWVVEGRLRGQYLVDGRPMDRVLVACFNPAEDLADDGG